MSMSLTVYELACISSRANPKLLQQVTIVTLHPGLSVSTAPESLLLN